MKTLFIDRKNTTLEVDRGRLLVRIDDAHPHFSVPTNILEMLVVSASVQFCSTLLTRLTLEGITVVFINPRQSDASTMTLGMMHNDTRRRLLQYRVITDATIRLTYARDLMRDKLRAQRSMLRRALSIRDDRRYALTTGIKRITDMIERLEEANNIDSLRGIEGAAAAAYFEAYQSIFPPSLHFNGRNRRPPRDPVNVVLSLSYTLLHAEAVRTLFATGFDPMLGIYHEPSFGRESLACDLVELFRPFAERWTWRLFADEVLCADHFSMASNKNDMPCMLGKRGRELYYMHYATKVQRWRRLMRRVVRQWLQLLVKSEQQPVDNNV